MDLETITDKLQGGSYALEIEFYKDIDLMFTNSFNYNTLKTSTVIIVFDFINISLHLISYFLISRLTEFLV